MGGVSLLVLIVINIYSLNSSRFCYREIVLYNIQKNWERYSSWL